MPLTRLSVLGFTLLLLLVSRFLMQAVRTGSGCGSVRVKPGQTLVGGDVMDDVTALDAYGTCAHVRFDGGAWEGRSLRQ